MKFTTTKSKAVMKPIAQEKSNNDDRPNNQKPKGPSRLEALLELEGALRTAKTQNELAYCIVNGTGRVLQSSRQSFLFLPQTGRTKFRLSHATSITTPDAQAPLVRALEKFINEKNDSFATSKALVVELPNSEAFQLPWRHGIILPLRLMNNSISGCLLVAFPAKPVENDLVIANRLNDAFSHAMSLFAKRSNSITRKYRNLAISAISLTALILLFALPVSQTALAPAQIVAKRPEIIAAPLEGAIKTIHVTPNTQVEKGQLLVSYEDTDLKGRYEIAARALEVAIARERRAQQGASSSQEMRSDLLIANSQRKIAEAERDAAAQLLARSQIHATRDGVVIFSNRDDLIGKPVKTGERLMEIADPERTHLRIELAIGDAIALEGDGEIRMFLDNDPLTPVTGKIQTASHLSEPTSDNRLIYPVFASLQEKKASPLRIGLRGTAQIFGAPTSLGFYLFRRPISALRQRFGL